MFMFQHAFPGVPVHAVAITLIPSRFLRLSVSTCSRSFTRGNTKHCLLSKHTHPQTCIMDTMTFAVGNLVSMVACQSVKKKPWDLRVQLRKIKDTRKNYKKKCRFLFKAGQCASVWLIGKSSTVTSAGLEVVSPLGTLTVRKSLMKIKHVLQNMWRICELWSSSQGGHCDSVILKHIK